MPSEVTTRGPQALAVLAATGASARVASSLFTTWRKEGQHLATPHFG
jgi:hypothetical protein